MALLRMILRKMVKNRVFIFFLAVGLLISAALLSSIPMYTDGALQRLLIKEMENFQVDQNKFPGTVMISYNANSNDMDSAIKDITKMDKSMFTYKSVKDQYEKRLDAFSKVDNYSKKEVNSQLGVPILAKFTNYSTDPRILVHDNFKAGDSVEGESARLESFTDFNQHVKIHDGRLPKKTSDGVYEVLVSEAALNKLNITLNKIYVLSDPRKYGFENVKVKPTGTYEVKDLKDPYWAYVKPNALDLSLILDEGTMVSDFIKKGPIEITRGSWFYGIDYHALTIDKLKKFIGGIGNINADIKSISQDTTVEMPAFSILGNYNDKKQQITNMMWSLNVPVIVILCLYMFMISGLVIEREKNEISLLSSRGASSSQIVLGYLIEGGILGVVAIVLGPILGYFLCKLFGASNGFLEFVDRKPLSLGINIYSYLYVLLAVFVFILTLLIPAYKANKITIVDHKKSIGRRANMPIWQRFYVDILILAIVAYGYNNFNQRQSMISKTGISALDFNIDPMFFLVPVLFILGIGLLFLRVYPLLIKLIYSIGKKRWSPSIYTAIIQVGRNTKSYNFLMIFLMLTLSVGIFSANSARTINQNAEEKIMYTNGADITIENNWVAKNPPINGPQAADATTTNEKLVYYEPSFNPYNSIKGIEHVAKVFTNDKAIIDFKGKSYNGFNFMGIDPYDFGNVAWYRDGISTHHINEYLNLLAVEPTACLISKAVSENCNVKVGDNLTVGWDGNKGTVFNVYGIIDYWPTFNPNKKNAQGGETNFEDSMLIVANLPYVQNSFGVEPYKVWLKMKPNATSQQVYDGLTANKITADKLVDSKQEIIKLKNDPFQLAINGSLTMGFLISGVICFMGFVLYWVLSLKSRSLQFGVLRAMGLTSLQLKVIIVWEQFLTSGVAMFMGVMIGLVASDIFVPFFQLSFSGSSQVPPFRVVSYTSDKIKVYCFIGFTIILGIGVLVYMLSKIKISNVIKLGED